MKWEIRKIDLHGMAECTEAVYFNGRIIPAQLIDYGRRGKHKVSFGIFADERINNSLTDKEIKELPTWHYLFYHNKDGLRCCKIWFEL